MGWFNTSAATGGTQITANTVVSSNITAWAMWVQNFTVTFNSNGGTPTPATRSIRSGLTVGTLPANPTRSGFTFMGWFNTSAATGGTQITANTVVSSNMTAWARWNQQVVQNRTVTFNPNGGNPTPANRTVANGQQIVTLPNNVTRTNHTFIGWFSTSATTGGTQITANTVVNANMTIWARWRTNSVNIINPQNNATIERQAFDIMWNLISGASYIVNMRNLNTNELVINNRGVNTGVNSLRVSQNQLVAGHRYRIAVGSVTNNAVNGWTEREFSVRGAGGNYIFPMSSYRISPTNGFFGWRGSYHRGIDLLPATRNDRTIPVVSVARGIIVEVRGGIRAERGIRNGANDNGGWGNTIVIQYQDPTHGRFFVRYAHLGFTSGTGVITEPHFDRIQIKFNSSNRTVEQGEILGLAGNTGSSSAVHLHFESFRMEPINNENAQTYVLNSSNWRRFNPFIISNVNDAPERSVRNSANNVIHGGHDQNLNPVFGQGWLPFPVIGTHGRVQY